MSLVKFIIFAALAGVFLYLSIISIQKLMESKEDVDAANKQVEEERAFYKSYGCTYNKPTEEFICPPETPDWVPKGEPIESIEKPVKEEKPEATEFQQLITHGHGSDIEKAYYIGHGCKATNGIYSSGEVIYKCPPGVQQWDG